MLSTLLCLPTWTLLEVIALSCYKTICTAQLLYITSIPIFGQHYEIGALIVQVQVRLLLPQNSHNVSKQL